MARMILKTSSVELRVLSSPEADGFAEGSGRLREGVRLKEEAALGIEPTRGGKRRESRLHGLLAADPLQFDRGSGQAPLDGAHEAGPVAMLRIEGEFVLLLT